MKDNNNHSEQRRDFLKKAGMLLGAGVTMTSLSSLIVSCEKDIVLPAAPSAGTVTISLSSYPVLSEVGGTAKVIGFVDGTTTEVTYIVRRDSQTDFVALEALCPHAGGDFILPTSTSSDQNLKCTLHQAEFYTDLAKEGQLASDPKGVKPRNLLYKKVDTSKLASGGVIVIVLG